MADPLLQLTPAGLYCPRGGFHVDPWLPVERAVITHAHADHARRGNQRYLAAAPGLAVLRQRLGTGAAIDVARYGETLDLNGVTLSLHPAGHVLGSAQVRLEADGEVWVVSGDYKTAPDPTCAAFEPLRCHTYVTESTFGLPIYRWPDQRKVFSDINAWWRDNQANGRATVLFAYALGKAQRLLAGIDAGIGPIFGHGAVENLHQAYRESGVALPPTRLVSDQVKRAEYRRALILAPPSAQRSPWTRRFGDYASGFASGWMLIRGTRRRRAVDRGFVLSDHADWPELLGVIRATGAERVLVTHGHTTAMVRWLREQGLEAHAVPTRFEGELDDGVESTQSVDAGDVPPHPQPLSPRRDDAASGSVQAGGGRGGPNAGPSPSPPPGNEFTPGEEVAGGGEGLGVRGIAQTGEVPPHPQPLSPRPDDAASGSVHAGGGRGGPDGGEVDA